MILYPCSMEASYPGPHVKITYAWVWG